MVVTASEREHEKQCYVGLDADEEHGDEGHGNVQELKVAMRH